MVKNEEKVDRSKSRTVMGENLLRPGVSSFSRITKPKYIAKATVE